MTPQQQLQRMLTPGQWPGIAVINGQDIGSLWQQDNDDPVIHDGPFKTSLAHTISPPGSFIFHFSTLPGDEPLNMKNKRSRWADGMGPRGFEWSVMNHGIIIIL